MGHPLGHADAAHLWDIWSRQRPAHLGPPRREDGAAARGSGPCNLTGWWTSTTLDLAIQNVSRMFIAEVSGGGFEMFNASLGNTNNEIEKSTKE